MLKFISPIFKDEGKIMIVGHRGFFTVLENSLIGFQAAISHGLKMVELDIWLSKDNIPIVIHCNDEGCISSTVTNAKGKIKDYTYEEIKQFQLGKNQVVPSLKEVFETCAKKIKFNIEIKEKDNKVGIIKETLKIIEEFGIQDDCLFSSFDHTYYDVLREMSQLEFKFLCETPEEFSSLKNRQINNSFNTSICVENNLITKEDVDYFHDRNQAVSIYFNTGDDCKNEDKLKKLYDMDVDHVIVDDPIYAFEHHERYYKSKNGFLLVNDSEEDKNSIYNENSKINDALKSNDLI